MHLKLLPITGIFALALLSQKAHSYEALPTQAPFPKDNPSSPEKINLGKALFFDPRISKDGTVSCNSCHNVMASGEDNRQNSVGVRGQKGGRTAPTVWNAAFMTSMFWDSRMSSLEDQAKGPMTNPIEMAMPNHDVVVTRIASIPGYQEMFSKAFGANVKVNINDLAKAIATYERTLITPNSAFDRFAKGDQSALSEEAKAGLKLVESTGCVSCHSGVNFAGPTTLPQGTGFLQKFPAIPGSKYEKQYRLTEDKGRFGVTKNKADMNLWRVPTWRNVALTAPYFHNGSVNSLDEAIRVMATTQLGKTLKDDEVKAIVAFLNSLTGEFPDQTMPRLPPTANSSIVGRE